MSAPDIHELKTWPVPFAAIRSGKKHHEIRKYDRDFKEGDFLLLREWRPLDDDRGRWTGLVIKAVVTYLTKPNEWGLPPNLCVMSIEVVP